MPTTPLYALSGVAGEKLLTTVPFGVSVTSRQVVLDFTDTSGTCYFTQSEGVVNLSFDNLGSVVLNNVNTIRFKTSANPDGIVTTCSPVFTPLVPSGQTPVGSLSESPGVTTTLTVDPCRCDSIEYLMSPTIAVFLDALNAALISQSRPPAPIPRSPFKVYLEELNTSIYSEIAATMNLKPTTENAVATTYITVDQANAIFSAVVDENDVKTIKIVKPEALGVLKTSALDTFWITYSDLFPTVQYPNNNPTDNVIIDLHRYLNKVAVPNRTLIVNESPVSAFANPASILQDHFNLGVQLNNYLSSYTGDLLPSFTTALSGNTFDGFMIGDTIQWKVTVKVQIDGLPLSLSSGGDFVTRVYLFSMNVVDTNHPKLDKKMATTFYTQLVSEDDTASGIYNSGSSISTKKYPWQYVDLSTSQYLSSNVLPSSTAYTPTAYTGVAGGTIIGDAV